jgi:FkbM family methyltransferase
MYSEFGLYDLIKHKLYQIIQALLFPNGIKRRINSTEIMFPIEFARYYASDNEPLKQTFIENHASGVSLDLGAHIGLYTVLLSRKCSRVIAFEPSSATRKVLSQTLKMNSCTNVEVRSECVTNASGEIVFYDTGTRGSNANSIAPIGKPRIEPSLRIDDLNIEFDFIKIDIEGSELVALQGALKTLFKAKFMTLEVHPALLKKIGHDPKDIFELLKVYNPQYFYLGAMTSPSDLENISYQYELNILLNSPSVKES